MKKRELLRPVLVVLTALAVLAAATLFAFRRAQSIRTYTLPEVDITLDIPGHFIVSTRSTGRFHPATLYQGGSARSLYGPNADPNLHLSGSDLFDNDSFLFLFVRELSDPADFRLQDDPEAYVQALGDSQAEKLEDVKAVLHKHPQALFYVLEGRSSSHPVNYLLDAVTIRDGQYISLMLLSDTYLHDFDREAFLGIVDSMQFPAGEDPALP